MSRPHRVIGPTAEPRTETSEASRNNPERPNDGLGIFTRHLQELVSADEPAPEVFDALWQALRAVLTTELRRQGAWLVPPSYFGVYGWESWQAWDPARGRSHSALEELLCDCYTFIFLERLPRLRAQLAMKPDIEGFVILYLRNYLFDRRKRHDLLGFHIFRSLRLAVRQAVAAGDLRVLTGDAKVSNHTVLAASNGASLPAGEKAEDLPRIVETWPHTLLPELVTAAGPRRRVVIRQLRDLLRGLGVEGVSVFRFKDLVDHLKHEVRASWAAIFEAEAGDAAIEDEMKGFARIATQVHPELDVERRESFDKLVACVAERVESCGESERTRQYLRTFWGFLRVWACGYGPRALPSSRGLGRLLRIPRKRFPGLWSTLQELVQICSSNRAARPFAELEPAEELS